MRFRKKPVVIEAVPTHQALYNASHDWKALPIWLQEAYEQGKVLFLNSTVEIKTLEGTMISNEEDYIIRGIEGELYPCKPDIFKKIYEAVE